MTFKNQIENLLSSYSSKTWARRLELAVLLDTGPMEISGSVEGLIDHALQIGEYTEPEINATEKMIFDGLLSSFRKDGGIFESSDYILTELFDELSFKELVNSLSEVERLSLMLSSTGYVLVVPPKTEMNIPLQTFFNNGVVGSQRSIEFQFLKLGNASSIRLVDGCGKGKKSDLKTRHVQQVIDIAQGAHCNLSTIQIFETPLEYDLYRRIDCLGQLQLSECVVAASKVQIYDEIRADRDRLSMDGLFLALDEKPKLDQKHFSSQNYALIHAINENPQFEEFKRDLNMDKMKSYLSSVPFEYLIDIIDYIDQM